MTQSEEMEKGAMSWLVGGSKQKPAGGHLVTRALESHFEGL